MKVRRDTLSTLRDDGMRPICSNSHRFSEFRFVQLVDYFTKKIRNYYNCGE